MQSISFDEFNKYYYRMNFTDMQVIRGLNIEVQNKNSIILLSSIKEFD